MNAIPRRTRPRGFVAWNPRPDSLALVQDVQAALADSAELTLPSFSVSLDAVTMLPS